MSCNSSRSLNGCSLGRASGRLLRELGVLHEQRGRVDPDARCPAVEPEPQHVLMLVPDIRVLPVQVGLLRGEEVQIPVGRLAVCVGCPGPGGAAEDRLPPVRRLLALVACAGPEPEARALARSRRRGDCLPEPRVLVRDVVRDDVDDRADSERARLGDQLLGLRERPERRVDRAVVRDVVSRIGKRRGVPRVEPERVDAEVSQVRQPGPDAGKVADPVAVRVGEAPDVDLVDDRVAPPQAAGGLRRRPPRSHPGRAEELPSPWIPSASRGEHGRSDNGLQVSNKIVQIFR